MTLHPPCERVDCQQPTPLSAMMQEAVVSHLQSYRATDRCAIWKSYRHPCMEPGRKRARMAGGGLAPRSKPESLGLMWPRYQRAGWAARTASATDRAEAISVLAGLWAQTG